MGKTFYLLLSTPHKTQWVASSNRLLFLSIFFVHSTKFMSYYDETNPHFRPRERPINRPPPPQHIQPETVQPWDDYQRPEEIQQPDRIQLRPRLLPIPRGSRPPRNQRRYDDRPPSTPPDHHQSNPHFHPVFLPPQSEPHTPLSHQRPDIHSTRPLGDVVQPQLDPQPPFSHQRPDVHSSRPLGDVVEPQLDPQPPLSHQRPDKHIRPMGVVVPPHRGQKTRPPSRQQRPHNVSFEQGPAHRENLMYPTPSRTKPLTWFGAVFCVILWLVIILGGLLVLIIYLIYRPRTPHFEISSATLNAAYLDLGYLLNADLTVLANFTNPNRKVKVDFSYITLQLYFNRHLIANQYIEPFSAVNAQSKLANVEMVSSQVRLPSKVTQQLITQIQRNRIEFEVDGIFHARSNFGSLLRYSYWLYGHCIIQMTGPPTGIMIASKCRTKD